LKTYVSTEPEDDDDEPAVEFVAPISAATLAAQAARDAVKVEQAEQADRQSRAAMRERDLAEMRLLNSGAAGVAAAVPMYKSVFLFLKTSSALDYILSHIFTMFSDQFDLASAAAHGMLPPPDVGLESGPGQSSLRASAADYKPRESRRNVKPTVPVPADFYRAPPKPEEKRVCGVPTGSCILC
jgi:hypothetical protein